MTRMMMLTKTTFIKTTLLTLLTITLTTITACSNFAMEDSYGLSVRTEDMGPIDFTFSLTANPPKSDDGSQFGFLALAAMKLGQNIAPLNASQGIKAGLNTEGVSCDKQTLRPTIWPPVSSSAKMNIDGALFCHWVLSNFANVTTLAMTLKSGEINFIAPIHDHDFDDGHFAIRDAYGHGKLCPRGCAQIFVLTTIKIFISNNLTYIYICFLH